MYYDCNTAREFNVICFSMEDVGFNVDTAFHLLDDFETRYLSDKDSVQELRFELQNNVELIEAYIHACTNALRAAKREIDVFTNPNSKTLRSALEHDAERMAVIRNFHGGNNNA